MRASERDQRAAGLLDRGAGERGGGVGLEGRARMQAEQPERARGSVIEVPVGPGEDASDLGARVAVGVEQVKQPAGVGQLFCENGQGRAHPGGDQLGRDSKREREPRALPGERRHGRRLCLSPIADQRPQQRDRVAERQQFQVKALRPVAGDEPGKRGPAGHQRHAPGGCREQRPDLFGVPRIVEQDQHPPAREQAPVTGGALGQVLRDVLPVHAERAQEAGQRVVRQHGRARIVAAQIHVELAIGELADASVRPAQCQRRLADAGGAANRRNDGRRGRLAS